jgi:TolB protein
MRRDRYLTDDRSTKVLAGLVSIGVLVVAGCAGRDDSLPPILYLQETDSGQSHLFSQDLDGETPRQLTGLDDPASYQVISFAVSPDGDQIAYSTRHASGWTGIWIMTADGDERDNTFGPLACAAEEAECAWPVWSPDGRLLYERRKIDEGLPGLPRLFWLDPATSQTLPLIEGNRNPSYGARFSPDGQWLSYVSPADEGVVLYRLADGRQSLLSSRTGSPAAWSPLSGEVVVGDIVLEAFQTAPETEGAVPLQESANVLLYRSFMDDLGDRQRISPEAAVTDSAPAFSPDGQWIAFGRAPSGTNAGRQLWIMRPDGEDARALTAVPSVTYGPPAWSPDGRFLLYQRYDLTNPEAAPSVWLLDVATGEETPVAERGYLPGWVAPSGAFR